METVQALCTRHAVDMAHAQQVAALALRVFDETQAMHQLDARARQLLETGALLHNVGVAVDEANHHTVGRDIVTGAKLKGFNTAERNILACIVAFHRKTVEPESELLFRVLTPKQQHLCLALSALVRLADGLDYSGTQTTQIKSVKLKQSIQIKTTGPHSYDDAARAQKKADLWVRLFGPLHVSGQIKTPGLHPDDTLAVAGRKLMRYWFAGVEIGDWRLEIEQNQSPISNLQSPLTKKLRVTTRRLRTVVLVFGEYYKPKRTRALFDGLRDLARRLSTAREADMLLERAEGYVSECDDESKKAFAPFVAALTQQQATAYEALQMYAHGEIHQAWVKEFAAFVAHTSPSKADRDVDVDTPSRVRHAGHMLLWQHVASVRAFDVLGDKPGYAQVHAARIAVKRLRYLAEGLREVLPADETQEWVQRCKQAQNALGALNDAHMADDYARKFVQSAQAEGKPVHLKAIEAYAREQARLAETQLLAWRNHLAPLLEDFWTT
jgi:CHAD domain-containing protein